MPSNSDIIHLTDKTFEAEVEKSKIPTVVDFWATWCEPCKMIAPHLDAIAKKYGGRVKIAKIDIEKQPKLTQKFGINSIPNLLFFNKGFVTHQIVGVTSRGKIEKAVEDLIEKANA